MEDGSLQMVIQDPHRWRILFLITTTDIGGTETVVRELALRLDRQAFRPVVCSLCPPGRIGQQIEQAGIPLLSLRMSARPRLVELATASVKLARMIDTLEIDLVQGFLYRANVMGAVAARFSRRRPIVVAGQRGLRAWGGWPAAAAARWTRRLCNRVVAVSEAVKAELTASENLRAERIVVIENGVDAEHYSNNNKLAARQELGLPLDGFVVGGVGRLSREKGFRHLVKSVAELRQRGFPMTLVLAGDGPDRALLQEQSRALGLDGSAKFLGVLGDPVAVYAASDVFALPSLREGSPNALLEAMASGCAVVATAVGGVPEIIEHERSGLLVGPDSPATIADAVARLAADPELRRRLGLAARRRVCERFSVAQMVGRHAELYRELLVKQRSPIAQLSPGA